ncbi:hypothetical protein DEO72_LG4g2730 [Vigna unguiculata]|uniref:Uncharacterized protein n=1 Tax=Vigna unguiculata TaxID=3917 RepID=A0A4D6LS51_VIGUN|nr:hypothetical protein DEO72_LG4g2730 [Vigna unguiculata]
MVPRNSKNFAGTLQILDKCRNFAGRFLINLITLQKLCRWSLITLRTLQIVPQNFKNFAGRFLINLITLQVPDKVRNFAGRSLINLRTLQVVPHNSKNFAGRSLINSRTLQVGP